MRSATAEEAVSVIRSGDRVYVQAAAAVPSVLLDALVARAPELEGVKIVYLHVEGPGPHLAPEMDGHFRHVALFIGPNARAAVNEGRAEYVPVFLHDTVDLSRSPSRGRSARTPSATGCTAASGARWTSSGGRRWRRRAGPSSPCPRRRPAGPPPASCRASGRGPGLSPPGPTPGPWSPSTAWPSCTAGASPNGPGPSSPWPTRTSARTSRLRPARPTTCRRPPGGPGHDSGGSRRYP